MLEIKGNFLRKLESGEDKVKNMMDCNYSHYSELIFDQRTDL